MRSLALVIAALALAGCAAPAATPADDARGALPTSLAASGCHIFGGSAVVPMDAARAAAFPRGYSPQSFEDAVARQFGAPPPGTDTLAQVTVELWRCDAVNVDNATTVASTRIMLGIGVEPPDELRRADAMQENVLLRAWSDAEDESRAFEAWGFGGRAQVDLSVTPMANGGSSFTISAQLGNTTVSVSASTPPPPPPSGAVKQRIFAAPDGAVEGYADIDSPDGWLAIGEARIIVASSDALYDVDATGMGFEGGFVSGAGPDALWVYRSIAGAGEAT